MSLYGVPFVKICEVNGGDSCMTCQVWYCMLHAMFYIFMPCFIYLCHLLYIYDMIYIFMSCFIFLCCVLYRYIIYVNFNTCYITIDLCCTKIAIFCCIVFSHLCCINTNLRCINTTNLCCIKICQQFHFFHYPIQWEVIITWSSLWSYLPYWIWNYKV